MALPRSKPFCGKAKVRPGPGLFLPYQRAWIEDESINKICEKSRQIGFTWSEAYAIDRQSSLVGASLDSWISSRDEIQARLFIDDCKKFAGVLNIGAEDLGTKVIDDKGNTAQILRFATGVSANSMSSNPDAQAGKRGHRTLDEFALHPDPRKLYSIAQPGVTWGGQMKIFSTHRGTANFFNELINEIKHKGNPKQFSLHTVTLQNALEQGFLYKLQSKLPPGDERQQMDEGDYYNWVRAKCADEETFLQEYMCVPGDDESAFLSYDLIASCEYKPTESWQRTIAQLVETGAVLYAGVDVGRKKDLTTIWIAELLGEVLYTRAVVVLEKMPFSQQEAALYEWMDSGLIRRIAIDATGLGMQFAERCGEKYGKYRVEEVTFSAGMKEELAYPVRSAFEDRTVRVPNDPKIRSDFRAIKKETTTSGNVRFTADAGENGHSDRFWALALCKHASKRTGLARISVA